MAKEGNLVNWFAAVMVVGMLMLVAVSAALYVSNEQLKKDKEDAISQADMTSTLINGQAAVQREILRVHSLLSGIAANCTTLGLNGSEVRAQINAAIAVDPYIQSMITFNAAGIVQVGEPARLHRMEGMNLTFKDNVALCIATRQPVLGNMVVPVVGDTGVAMDVPIFDQAGVFQGAVNALMNVSALMAGAVAPLTVGTQYSWWSMQMNGTVLFDSEGVDVTRNILSPEYAAFPQLQAIAWTMLNQTSGYGKYSYTAMSGSQVVSKQCFWCPIGLLGNSWRLVITERV
jgi:hypothetical protein